VATELASGMGERGRRAGTVLEFDEHRGLGVVAAE
jgi:hypothetical protein